MQTHKTSSKTREESNSGPDQRRVSSEGSDRINELGNQAIQRHFANGAIKSSLSVGAADDPAEREAEEIADRVVRGETPDDGGLGNLRRDEWTQSTGGDDLSNLSLRGLGPGSPLDDQHRSRFEDSIGADFSSVRLHTGTPATAAAAAIGAQAFTAGSNIVFGRDSFQPDSQRGQRLLAHELTHVLQQRDRGHAAINRSVDPLNTTITRGLAETMSASEIEESVARARSALSSEMVGSATYDALRENINVLEYVANSRGDTLAPVRPSGESFESHDGKMLSRDPAQLRLILENQIVSGGAGAANYWVNELATHVESLARRNEADAQFSEEYYRDPHLIPAGVPLPAADIAAGADTAALGSEIVDLARTQSDILREENRQFMSQFGSAAMSVALNMLAVSKSQVEAEIERYGLTEEEVMVGYTCASGVVTEAQYNATENDQTLALMAAANSLAEDLRFIQETDETRSRIIREAWYDYLRHLDELDFDDPRSYAPFDQFETQMQIESGVRASANAAPTLAMSSEEAGICEELMSDYDLKVGSVARLNAILVESRIDYEITRHELEQEFPVLAAYTTEADPATLERIGAESGGAIIAEKAYETLGNIRTVREAINDGDQSVWLLPNVVNMAKAQQLVIPGSMRDRLIEDKVSDEEPSMLAALALAVFTIAAGIILAIPSGGGSLAVSAAVLAGELSLLALDAYLLYDQINEYNIASAATGTDFNAARAISSQEPSLFWLVVGIIGTGVGAAGAARAFGGVARARNALRYARNADEAAESVARLNDEVRRVASETGLDPASTARRVLDEALESGNLSDEVVEAIARSSDEAVSVVDDLPPQAVLRSVTEARRAELNALREGNRWAGNLEAELRGWPAPPDGQSWRFVSRADFNGPLQLVRSQGSVARGIRRLAYNSADNTFEFVDDAARTINYPAVPRAPRVPGPLAGNSFRMPASMRRRLDRLLRKRDRLRALRDVYQELGDEANFSRTLGQITRTSEHLGEEGAERWVRRVYGRSAEKVFGDIAGRGATGEFDQIWRIPGGMPDGRDLLLVIEAKGGAATLGTRRVPGAVAGTMEVAQQGSAAYYDDIVRAMRSSGRMSPELATEMSEALSRDAIRYLEVKTPIRTRGGAPALNDITIREFSRGGG